MSFRRYAILFVFISTGVVFLMAKDFWENPFDKWNQKEVAKMLTDSPWAGSQVITNAGLTKEGGRGGENETYYKFTARFFSAMPIREAYVMMSRIRNNYDGKNADEKKEFDARFNKPLTLDFSDQIVIALDYSSNPNDANFVRDIKNFLETASAETLKQNVYLITKSKGRVDLKEYHKPGELVPSAVFVFPRVMDGKPIVAAEDKDLRFQVGWVAGVNQEIHVDYKPQKMTYKGKLEL
jgi:hypothetical protein